MKQFFIRIRSWFETAPILLVLFTFLWTMMSLCFCLQFYAYWSFTAHIQKELGVFLQVLENLNKMQENDNHIHQNYNDILTTLLSEVETIKQIPLGQNQRLRSSLGEMTSQLKQLRSRVDKYDSALGDDPAKTLAVPLLRKDIDNLQESSKTQIGTIRDEMIRNNESMRWLIGMVVAIAALILTIVGVVRASKPVAPK